MMNHSFDIEIAKKYSVDEAIFLNHIAFWIQKNIANKKHFHEGQYWTYSSYPAFLDDRDRRRRTYPSHTS